MKTNKLKKFEIIAFIYFFVGAILGILMEYTNINFEFLNIIILFYAYTFPWTLILYLIFGCILCKHRYFIMNIIDGILCFCLALYYPIPIFTYIYDSSKYLYYFLGGCFSFLPLIFCIIDKTEIDIYLFLKMFTRVFMIIFLVMIILMLKSCNIDG